MLVYQRVDTGLWNIRCTQNPPNIQASMTQGSQGNPVDWQEVEVFQGLCGSLNKMKVKLLGHPDNSFGRGSETCNTYLATCPFPTPFHVCLHGKHPTSGN
jgi:hypothetical protein